MSHAETLPVSGCKYAVTAGVSSGNSGLWLAIGLVLGLASATGCQSQEVTLGGWCSDKLDCADSLQCLYEQCVPRCTASFECGEGMACSRDGSCVEPPRLAGEACLKEWDCGEGLTCLPMSQDEDEDGWADTFYCAQEHAGSMPIGGRCQQDQDCRAGVCVYNMCAPVCDDDADCPPPYICVPMSQNNLPRFYGCTESRPSPL